MVLISNWNGFIVGLSEKLNEVVGHDVFYLLIKSVTPQRRSSAAKETLVDIEFAKNNQRLALHIDRRTKRGDNSNYNNVQYCQKSAQRYKSKFLYNPLTRSNLVYLPRVKYYELTS